MLENIQHHLDGIYECGPLSDPETHRGELQQEQETTREVQDDYMYNEEDQDFSTHVRKRATQAETSRDHQQHRNMTVSYYIRIRSHLVDKPIKSRRTLYVSDSSFKDDYNDHIYITGRQYTSPTTNIEPFHSSTVGRLNMLLCSTKPPNKKFDKLMSY